MDNSNEPPPRRTLKLKVSSDKTKVAVPRASVAITPAPRASPGAPHTRDPTAWADAHKKKMQAEMDALSSGADYGALDPPTKS